MGGCLGVEGLWRVGGAGLDRLGTVYLVRRFRWVERIDG